MGLAFWAIRDIAAGEEAWFDYRLSPVIVECGDDIDFQYPSWYHPVDPDAVLGDVEASIRRSAGNHGGPMLTEQPKSEEDARMWQCHLCRAVAKL